MKKILISIILLSICYSSSDEGLSNAYPLRGSEYSLGISDKVGFFGFSSHSWVTRQESFETYITMGTSMIILGSIGYGQKHYLIRPKGRFFSPYYSFTGFLYYLLPMSEHADAEGSLGVSCSLGIDLTTIKWRGFELIFQAGILAAYDPFNGRGLVIPGEGGPNFIMPSLNVKCFFGK